MATLSLRMRDDLKRKAQLLAAREGVSLNNFVNATLAATVSQDEATASFRDRLRDVDLGELHSRVLKFMRQTTPGPEPTPAELRNALGDRY
ncbi:MAG: toxin-antitoxin system HicB family antitoxin [Lentisphaerae bacterium]|nr:toxin-antitoxin system HicB family antitoxin [Lentisphaerota bacterium]